MVTFLLATNASYENQMLLKLISAILQEQVCLLKISVT